MLVQFTQLAAQNNTKSIYSSYGIGVFQSEDANAYKGMAGSSFGYKHGFKPNLGNLLSIANRERVDFDFGFEFNNRLQQTSLLQKTDLAGNVNHVSIAFNALRYTQDKNFKNDSGVIYKTKTRKIRWNTMLGLAPYTAMDYDFAIEGDSNTYNTLLSVGGSGGLNAIHWNNAFQLFDTTITFGFGVQRLFGSIKESQLKNILSDSNSIGYQQTIDQRIKGWRIPLSIGYSGRPSSKSKLWHTFSAKYTLASNLNSETDILLRTVQDFFQVKDTISLSSPNGEIKLPSAFRLGYGIQNENKWAWTLDFQTSNLSSYSNSRDSGVLSKMSRYSTGFILNPDRIRSASRKLEWYRRLEWNAGLFYQTGPYSVKINNSLTNIDEYGISFGIGLPMRSKFTSKKDVISFFYLSTQYSQRGSTDNNLIKEDIFRVNLAFNLSDIWFKKRAFY